MFHRVRDAVHSRMSPGRIAALVVVGTVVAVAAAVVFGYVAMLLWNALMPALFGLATIGYWQAVGLIILARILVGGHGGRHPSHAPRTSAHPPSPPAYGEWWHAQGREAFEAYLAGKKGPTASTE